MKRCSQCLRLVSRGLFAPDHRTTSGTAPYCLACDASRKREQYAADPARHRARTAAYKAARHAAIRNEAAQ